jgi:hypothetical protein
MAAATWGKRGTIRWEECDIPDRFWVRLSPPQNFVSEFLIFWPSALWLIRRPGEVREG